MLLQLILHPHPPLFGEAIGKSMTYATINYEPRCISLIFIDFAIDPASYTCHDDIGSIYGHDWNISEAFNKPIQSL